MGKQRYIVTITEAEAGNVKILVIDQKQSKIIHDSISTIDLRDVMKRLFITQYGNEVMFIEK